MRSPFWRARLELRLKGVTPRNSLEAYVLEQRLVDKEMQKVYEYYLMYSLAPHDPANADFRRNALMDIVSILYPNIRDREKDEMNSQLEMLGRERKKKYEFKVDWSNPVMVTK